MNTEEAIIRLRQQIGQGSWQKDLGVGASLVSEEILRKELPLVFNLIDLFTEEVPEYSFALTEEVKDDLRFTPTKAYEEDTGWDVRAALPNKKTLVLRPGERALIPLGFRAFCPNGYWLELKSRSSSFTKKSLHCLIVSLELLTRIFLVK